MLRNNWVVSGIFLTGILRLNLKRREIWNFEQAVSKIFPCETCTFFVSTVFQSFRTEVGFASIKLVLHTTMRHSIKYWSIFFSELIVSAEFIWQEIQGVENWKKNLFLFLFHIPHYTYNLSSFHTGSSHVNFFHCWSSRLLSTLLHSGMNQLGWKTRLH